VHLSSAIHRLRASRTVRSVPALVTAVLVTAAVLAGCGAGDGGPIVVVSGQQSQNGALLGRQLGASVELRLSNDTDVATSQKVMLDAASGQAPDVVRVTNATYRTLVDRGLAQPTDACLGSRPDLAAQLDPRLVDDLRVDGRLMMIPWYVTPNALVYNAALFRAAGLDPDRPPTTFGEAAAAGQAIAALPGRPAGLVSYFGNDYNFQGYVASLGGSVLGPDGTRAGIASPVGAAVFDSFRAAAARGISPVYPNFFTQTNDAFASGGLGMLVTSASSYPALSARLGADVRMAPAPYPDGGRAVTVSSTNGFVILTRDPERQARACQALLGLVTQPAVTETVAATATIPLNAVARDDPQSLGRVYAAHPDWREVAAQPRIPWTPLPRGVNAEYQDLYLDAQVQALRGRPGAEVANELGGRADALLRGAR